MKAFIDSENKLHTENDGTMTEVDVALDDQCKMVIEGYKFFPETGLLILWKDPAEIFGAQAQWEDTFKSISTAISYLDDEQAETVTDLYPFWSSGVAYEVGDRVQFNGLLYRCVQAHTSQEDWTPDKVPALWVRTWTDPFPEWVQPTGAHDAYAKGDTVSFNGKHWISDVNANVWQPGIYGWSEIE